MRRYSQLILVLQVIVGLLITLPAHAAIEAFEFDNAEQEARFNDLTKILRCPKCQNQNISDSNAELAQDLRHKTYDLVKQGKSEDEVIDYMVARFGNFVRYDPPMTIATIFLWVGPFCFVLFGFVFLYRKTKQVNAQSNELSEEEQQRLASLIDEQNKSQGKSS